MSFLTCKEVHEHGHPAQDVGPGEAPVPKASPEEVDCHSSVNGHTEQNKESCGERDVNVSKDWCFIYGLCVDLEETRLTGDEKHDSCSKGAVEPFKRGEVSKRHDASYDAGKAKHPWKDHEGPGHIPVSWKETGRNQQSIIINSFTNM